MTQTGTQVVTYDDIVARFATDQGFTFDPDTGSMVFVGDRDGWAVARPGSERLIGATLDDRQAFVNAFIGAYMEARESGALVGGWYSRERNVYMCEVTDMHTVDRATAVVLGLAADQETVMNMRTGEVAAVPHFRDGD